MQIRRLCFEKLWGERKHREISIILGARQVGKSTLLRQLEKQARKQNFKTVFFDFEQPSDLKDIGGSESDIIQNLGRKRRIVFIDEFHYLKNASKIFKAVYDSRSKVKIYASGSSSLEMHKHLKESLAGRFIKTMVYPPSLVEWGQVKGFRPAGYLQWGGLPGLIHRHSAQTRAELLENILSTYVTKDVKGLIKEENIKAFNSLLYSLAQCQGSVSAASNLSRETGIGEPSVARYLELMKQTYVLFSLESYATNMANELKKSKKHYFFDIGIRNVLLKDFRAPKARDDKGALYETAVLLHLIPQLKPNMEVRFWRTKKQEEVDFILLKNRVPVPVEVKSSLRDPGVPKGMTAFMQRYSKAPFGIVYGDSPRGKTIWTSDGRPVYFENWTQAAKVDYLQDIF